MSEVVIIGAGVAGLATAGLLARQGFSVTVLEQLDRIGGRAGTVERNGFRFDTGPSWYLMPRVYDHWFAMMGTSTQEQLGLTVLDPGYRVFAEPEQDGPARILTVPQGEAAVRDLFDRVEPGAGRRLNAYLASARRTSRMAEDHFLYNPYTRWSTLLDREVLTNLPRLARLLLGRLEGHIARRFADPLLRQVLGYPAIFLGTDPASAPAMYHLMSAMDLSDPVVHPQGGFGRVVDRVRALAEAAGARIVTGARVEAITTRQRGRRARVSGVIWRRREGSAAATVPADIVVSAADLHHTETELLPPGLRTYPQRWWQRRTSGPGAVIALLGVRGELPELAHHSLFFVRDWRRNFDAIFGDPAQVPRPASVYVCRPSATDDTVAPPGHENLFVLVPVAADVDLGRGGPDGTGSEQVEQIVDDAVDQISRWADIPDLRQRIVVRHSVGPADFAADYHSWRGGMLGPAHTLRQSAMFRAQNASRRVDGLYYAGGTTAPGVGVPMCLISAELVLKRILGDHSASPRAPSLSNGDV